MEAHQEAMASAIPEPALIQQQQHQPHQPQSHAQQQPGVQAEAAAAAAAAAAHQIDICLPVGGDGSEAVDPNLSNKRKFEVQQQQQQQQQQPPADSNSLIMRIDSQGREVVSTPMGDVVFSDTPLRWYPSAITIEARTFDGQTVNADLMKVIGRGVKANKCTLSERFYLPPQYNKNTAEYRAKTIAPIFSSACAMAGCEVRLKGWEKSKGFLKFVCPHYRRYNKAKGGAQSVQRSKETGPPMNGSSPSSSSAAAGGIPMKVENNMPAPAALPPTKKSKANGKSSNSGDKEGNTCPFSFLVFWEEYAGQENVAPDERQGRWFICATGAGTPFHQGHLRKEFSEQELRRKQLHVEGAYEILLPFYKKIVELIDRDEDKLNDTLGRLRTMIDGLKKRQSAGSGGKQKAQENTPATQHQVQQEVTQFQKHEELMHATGLTDHHHQSHQQHVQHQEQEGAIPEPTASPQFHHHHHHHHVVDDLVNLAASTQGPLPQHPVPVEAATSGGATGADAAATEAALALDQSVINEVATL
mmetsp:Transcript_21884/g.50390  ORF Transcript_21884/g.50390 Transcript_21884/m.50390 type:complete len:529 (+) Transcript_21884:101-1687(+)